MEIIAYLTIGALALGGLATLFQSIDARPTWGTERLPPIPVGDDPYRSTVVSGGVRRRRWPTIAVVASVTTIAWGLITVLLFAPSGLFLTVIAMDGGPLWVPVSLAMLLVSGHGFAMGVQLCGVSGALSVRRPDSAARARDVARTSMIHHAVVAGIVGLIGLARDGRLIAVTFLAWILCAIGIGLALLVGAAGRRIAAFDDADDAEEAAPRR